MTDKEFKLNNFLQREDLEQVIERMNKALSEIYCEVIGEDSYQFDETEATNND